MNEIIYKILICLLAGLGAGLGTGFAGMSAVTLIGPLLITFLDIPTYQAIGIGLLSDVLASLISALTYRKNKNLDIKKSVPLLISVLIFTFIGSLIGTLIPNKEMGCFMQISMILIGISFLVRGFLSKKNPENKENTTSTNNEINQQDKKKNTIKSIICGSVVGLICGISGAGGGMMLLFVLTTFLGYEMHVAVGTSVFIMAFTALTGGVSHLVIGGVADYLVLIFCIIFTLVFSKVASLIANKISSKSLKIIIGSLLSLTGILLLVINYLL